eukprot:8823574-Karenia_brevis.AAC.1
MGTPWIHNHIGMNGIALGASRGQGSGTMRMYLTTSGASMREHYVKETIDRNAASRDVSTSAYTLTYC